MTSNPNLDAPAEDQKPIVNNWNANEFGLQPRNLIEKIGANFIKAFAYNFGWDAINSIWRMLRVNAVGNLIVTNGTQSAISPISNVVNVSDSLAPILASNANRRYVLIYNDEATTNHPAVAVSIRYPNPISDSGFILPPGFVIIEDSWQGSIDSVSVIGSDIQRVTVVEFA